MVYEKAVLISLPNILLTNRELRRFGGTETWTKTMYDYLSKDYNVDVFTAGPHSIYTYMDKYIEDKKYDLTLMNHRSCANALKNANNLGKVVFTSHGVIPNEEKPVDGMDIYVGVSEETQKRIESLGYKAEIIRNPINTSVFVPKNKISSTIESAAFVSTYQRGARNTIEQVCDKLNIDLITVGVGEQTNDVPSVINSADLVFGLGRTAYEAMSCARNVLVFDYRGGDGLVTPDNIYKFRENNCSGRYMKKSFTAKDLMDEVSKYDSQYGSQLRNYIKDNNSVELIAQQYLRFL